MTGRLNSLSNPGHRASRPRRLRRTPCLPERTRNRAREARRADAGAFHVDRSRISKRTAKRERHNLIELTSSNDLIAPARSVYVLLHNFFSGELRDAPNSIAALTATSSPHILRVTDGLGSMSLTPERIVRVAARRRSHNEFTGVTHSKSGPPLSTRSSKWSPTARRPICDNLSESPPLAASVVLPRQ
jgi:hypothetical protein